MGPGPASARRSARSAVRGEPTGAGVILGCGTPRDQPTHGGRSPEWQRGPAHGRGTRLSAHPGPTGVCPPGLGQAGAVGGTPGRTGRPRGARHPRCAVPIHQCAPEARTRPPVNQVHRDGEAPAVPPMAWLALAEPGYCGTLHRAVTEMDPEPAGPSQECALPGGELALS